MSKAIRLRDQSQKSVVKLIDSLCGRYSRWEVWQDFIIMSAISISNVIKGPHNDRREKQYLDRANKYSAKELETFAQMLAEVTDAMEQNPDQDFLGELFMALNLGNEWKGQFFTPYNVCRLMAAMTYGDDLKQKITQKGWVSVSDPACGAGAICRSCRGSWRRRIGRLPCRKNKEGDVMKSVIERMEEENTAENIELFRQFMLLPYEAKKRHAELRAREFVNDCCREGLNYHVSVGGLDSITLLLFLRSIGIDAPAVSVSGLEDISIQRVHKQLGVERLQSAKRDNGKPWTKAQVIQDFGFPVLSKEIASKIDLLQNPSEKNATVRHAIITGETGEYGGFRTGTRMQLAQRWLELFGGYENENEGVDYQIPPFKVSSKCCYYLKEKPADDWAREHNSVPFLGLMASEGGRRQKSLMMHGCNYWGKTTIRSCPFAIFNRQDLLQLALELDVPVPEIYGDIVRDPDGTFRTTKAQRTGCSMCGFGIHLEKRPHRFDRLRESNPREWEYWMMHCCKDADGTEYGWGRVLDYIGVEWRQEMLDGF